jgi:hypothetical protein
MKAPKKNYYEITRIVRETFEVQATSKKEAADILASEGGQPNVEVIKETVKLKK